jgi:hypothetical protein
VNARSAPPLRLALRLALFAPLAPLVPLVGVACVQPGNSTPSDSGAPAASAAATSTVRASVNVMTAPFTDNFDRPNTPFGANTGADAATSVTPALVVLGDAGPTDAAAADAKATGDARPDAPGEGGAVAQGAGDRDAAPAAVNPEMEPVGPDWMVTSPTLRAWRIENGKLCGQNAKNHGIWLKRTLPINARVEYDAITSSEEGDLKSEVWGDGVSAATSTSYTNATSYLAIFGGWKNTVHALARINEHGDDRKEIKVDPTSDDPRQKPVVKGQQYHIKVERTDGRTVKFYVDDLEYLTFPDAAPLTGAGHDHFGFNEWQVKVCFDNVKITPL